MGNCCQPSDNNDFFLISDRNNQSQIKNNRLIGGLLDIFGLNTDNPMRLSSDYSEPGEVNEISKMEDELFNLINCLRSNPQQFIYLIEKYKNLISEDPQKGTYFIIINSSRIDLNQGKEYFTDCQNFLKTAEPQKNLIKDDNLKIPKPSRVLTDEENDIYVTNYINKYIISNPNATIKYSHINYIVDQNISDVLFVIILNLIGVESENNIKTNFMLSAEYDSVGITVDKIDPENNIYCYYCVFGKTDVK